MANFIEGTAFGVLNDILSAFRSNEGYALPSRYEVLIYPPAPKTGGSLLNVFSGLRATNEESRNVSLRCESVQLPGRTVTSSPDNNIYGPLREIANEVTYSNELVMTFQASSGLEERIFFEQWQQKCFNPETWNVGYYSEYVGSADVYLLDVNNQRRYGLKIHEMWPKTVAATDLTAARATDIIKNSITFAFRTWSSLDIDQTPPSIADKITQTVVNSVERNITANIPAVLRKL